MNQFVQMYQHLQFDCEEQESIEEQASKLGGRIIKFNIPIEANDAQIYTRNMYEKFCQLIFESGNYVAYEIIPHMKYRTKHIRSEKWEKWEKVQFDIDVMSNGEQYICECGLSEHMGMLCPRIIRVSIHICHGTFSWICAHNNFVQVFIQFGIHEIPRKHIVKR